MFGRKKTLQLGMEDVPEGEDLATSEIVKMSLAEMNIARRPVLRGQHPKSHGCVRARFEVFADIRDELKHGLFKTARSYDALVRFSNSQRSDDSLPDPRGMAVKLLEEGTGIQDFVMIDHPVFFICNAADYVVFSRAFIRSRRSRIVKKLAPFSGRLMELVRGMILINRFYWKHWRELWISIKLSRKPPRNVLDIQYWSSTPYRLGPHAVKFSARPVSLAGDPCHGLRDSMRQDLQYCGVTFDFLVQLQTDPKAMPVEDPTVNWDEHKSPYRRVGRIQIDPQDLGPDAGPCRCENLSFSPWNSLPEHEPLGGINRVRKEVYRAVSERRIQLNQEP